MVFESVIGNDYVRAAVIFVGLFLVLKVALYVIAHEVAHLKEQRHTESFWRQVESLDGDFEQHRKWLKRYGYTLVL